ncbi:unnamed protein product, partial [Choristocarpus tenellus]
EAEAPPGHWKCKLCRRVNAFPEDWKGKSGTKLKVVVKRKEIDTQTMYAVVKTVRDAPSCSKCFTPYNYTGRLIASRQGPGVRQPRRPHNRAATIDKINIDRKVLLAAPPPHSSPLESELESSNFNPGTAKHNWMSAVIRKPMECFRRHISKHTPLDQQQELWYTTAFRKDLTNYFRPQFPIPALGPQEQYAIGARVFSCANKNVWYPGLVERSRNNNTYDIRYDNGGVARHVFPEMIRFQPVEHDSPMIVVLYAVALGVFVSWPLVGVLYYSSTAEDAVRLEPLVAVPVLVFGLVACAAVATQFLTMCFRNGEASWSLHASFAALYE